jgi:flagellar biosynthesis protein FlhA
MVDTTNSNSSTTASGASRARNMMAHPVLAAVLRPDIGLAVGVVLILSIMLVPIPTLFIDVMLAFSFTLSVLILMTSLFIQKPLDFSSFPTILLISTVLRIALNVASTKLILAHGHEGPDAAGHVIEAFGGFLMGGNYVIGLIVFFILITINFIVITKGSGRIAEVSARFTLDAIPGKQMAIDADLSAGMITEDQARKRRQELEDESTFFGAMDGASKFVRGDAIAGLLVTFINIVGGMIIGIAQQGLGFAEAAKSYTLLTVGDGLVSQIPALLVSTAAGLVITKAGVRGSVDKALFAQLGGYPQALGMSSFLTGFMALLPGLPFLPFALLAGITGYAAYKLGRNARATPSPEAQAQELAAAAPVAEEPISSILSMDTIRLELGYGLLGLVNVANGPKLTDQIKSLRKQLAGEMGFVLPSVRIQDNLQLGANDYCIKIKELVAGRGSVRPGMVMVMDPQGQKIGLAGEETTEPTFGLPAMWVLENLREEAQFRGYTVVDSTTVITTHLTELIKDYMAELLSYSETQKLLDELDKEHQKLIGDIIPGQIQVGGVQRVLQNLVGERVSIRDLPTILEGVAEVCGQTRNIRTITEHVRMRLARQISEAYSNEEGVIPILTMSPDWEQTFADSLIGQGEERQLALAPSRLQQFIADVRSVLEHQAMLGVSPCLLTGPQIRPFVRQIMERVRPQTAVLSQNEIYLRARIKTVGQI